MQVFKDVSLSYNSQNLILDVNLELHQKCWISILGKSGCGKSTMLRLLAGLDVFCEVSGYVKSFENVSWMGQTDNLFPWLNAIDNALMKAKYTGTFTIETYDRAIEIFDSVGLKGLYDKYPAQLSGGQRQRVALVRSILTDGDLILMDEPFSALDAITGREVSDLSKQLFANKSVVMVTHNLNEAIRLSDELYVVTNKKKLEGPYNKANFSDINFKEEIYNNL